jgi:hypothetical protein
MLMKFLQRGPTMSNFGKHEKFQVTREQIEKRAYEIYQRRGGLDGTDLDDWLVAERELFAEQDRTDGAEGPSVPLYARSSSTPAGTDSEYEESRKPRSRAASAGDRSSSS